MIFAFLDEFGHSGPFISRDHPKFNTSPVFGLAGYLMPENRIRGFGTCFLQIKKQYLSHDPTRKEKPFHEWEKKGTNFFTASSIKKYPNVKDCMFRVLREIRAREGKVFYHGRQKISGKTEGLNPNGLYTTVFADAIRQIDNYCETRNESFVIVLDEHSARKELLVTAAKTMFGNRPTRRMICPPFEVESHLNQNIQAADWIATILGRIWNFEFDPVGFEDQQEYRKYFAQRMEGMATHSRVIRRNQSTRKEERPGTIGEIGRQLQAAGIKGTTALN